MLLYQSNFWLNRFSKVNYPLNRDHLIDENNIKKNISKKIPFIVISSQPVTVTECDCLHKSALFCRVQI